MARKANKKEQLANAISRTLVYGNFPSCDPLVNGFISVVSTIRTPDLDTAVLESLEVFCDEMGLGSEMVAVCYSMYSCW